MKTTRGQTLVFMALTGLLCVLMVMMTVSIGQKVKEKMELQTMADSAAYSQAVATARAFNSVSLQNRAGVAHVTGALAIQSLVSWSTFYHSTLYEAARNIQVFRIQYVAWAIACCIPFSPCMSACRCAIRGIRATTNEINSLNRESRLFTPYFRSLDRLAALELLAVLSSADWLHLLGQLPVLWTLGRFIAGQNGVDRLVNTARSGTVYNELVVDGSPVNENNNEIGTPAGFALPPKGALMALNPIWNHHAFAAMGTRLHPFITGRFSLLGGDAANLINLRLIILTRNPFNLVQFLIPGTAFGSGYLNRSLGQWHGDPSPSMAWFSRFMTADDHGILLSIWNIANFAQCPIFPIMVAAPYAYIWSSAANGRHQGSNWRDNWHILGAGVGGIRSYPWFFDYHMFKVMDAGDIWAQPKMFGVVKRNYAARPYGGADQWNPFFRFGFTASSTSVYDQRGLFTRDGTNIGTQTAVGTGVTYYHRGNNFLGYHSGVEPPNFFNPYWRGGLTRVNVDNSGLNDFRNATGVAAANDSFDGLRMNGFQGWQ